MDNVSLGPRGRICEDKSVLAPTSILSLPSSQENQSPIRLEFPLISFPKGSLS